MKGNQYDEFKELIPGIATKIKTLKTRRNTQAELINKVIDHSMTLITKAEADSNLSIQKSNIFQIEDFFHKILKEFVENPGGSSQIQLNYISLYKSFENDILKKLESVKAILFESSSSISNNIENFFKSYSDGLLNNSATFQIQLEDLIAKAATVNFIFSEESRFSKIEQMVNQKKLFIADSIEFLCKNLSTKNKFAPLFLNSKIIRPDEFGIIGDWIIDCTNFEMFSSELVFTTEDHGYRASEFHKRCDDQGPTIVFILTTEDFRFGGFANQSWFTRQRIWENGWRTDKKNFLFSLDLKLIFPHKPNDPYSMYGDSTKGPLFGGSSGGHDIEIDDNCAYVDACHCYQDSYDYKGKTPIETGMKQDFTVKCYEVFKIIGYQNQKIFVEQKVKYIKYHIDSLNFTVNISIKNGQCSADHILNYYFRIIQSQLLKLNLKKIY